MVDSLSHSDASHSSARPAIRSWTLGAHELAPDDDEPGFVTRWGGRPVGLPEHDELRPGRGRRIDAAAQPA